MLYNTLEVTGLIIITFAVSCMGAYLGVIARRQAKHISETSGVTQ